MQKSTIPLLAVLIFSSLANAQQTPETMLINPQATLKVKDSVLRQQVIIWSQAQLNEKNYKKIKAYPSADFFSGKVANGVSLTSKIIHIAHNQISNSLISIVDKLDYAQPWNKTLYSTGLYAVPGEYIEVVISEVLTSKGLEVQIGIHSDNLGGWVAATEDWRRMPLAVKQVALTEKNTRINNAFGGLIYIVTDPKAASWQGDIKISRAIQSPLFEAGKTTLQDWQRQLKNNKAPLGELLTNNVIITLPNNILQKVIEPEKVMRLWNTIIAGEMELAQIPQPTYRPQRLVVDEHIGGGFMHSGYPIMIHHSPSRKLLSADIIADPAKLLVPSNGGANGGFFHEIGHNMQNQDWVFGGTTEVSCNFFSLYMFDR